MSDTRVGFRTWFINLKASIGQMHMYNSCKHSCNHVWLDGTLQVHLQQSSKVSMSWYSHKPPFYIYFYQAPWSKWLIQSIHVFMVNYWIWDYYRCCGDIAKFRETITSIDTALQGNSLRQYHKLQRCFSLGANPLTQTRGSSSPTCTTKIFLKLCIKTHDEVVTLH
jgi:hypothetical protein